MIVFSHIPKTAGTSLKYILRKNFGLKHIDALKTQKVPYTDKDLAFAKKVFPDPRVITGHNVVDPLSNFATPEDELITMLREPYTRCASHYQDSVMRGGIKEPFESWISDPDHQNLSVRIIAGSDDTEKARELLQNHYSFVGITEKFSESLKLFSLSIGRNLDTSYRRLVTARSNRIKNELMNDEHSLRLLKLHNEKDRELYDFALNEIFYPALEKHSDHLEEVPPPEQLSISRNEPAVRKSIRFNKYIYRQLIKVRGT